MATKDFPMDQKELADFCHRHHIQRLSFFGSIVRPDFRLDSDIDVLVEFVPGQEPGLFGLVEMQNELERRVGRQIDLRTPGELSKYFRDDVLASAQVQYAEG